MGEWPQHNKGIIIGGNARVNGAMAAGDGAFAQSGPPRDAAAGEAAETVLAALAELRRRLDAMERADGAALPRETRRAARTEAAALEEELASGEADPRTAGTRAQRLQALLGGVTTLTGLLTAVQEGVRGLTGG